MAKRRLPVLVEHGLGEIDAARISIAAQFEQKVASDADKAKTRITCKPGCSSCCYHPVSISILEGLLLYQNLVKNGKYTPALKEGLQAATERQLGVSYEVWLLSMTPCPLLDGQQKCSAYSARPLICRTYLATSDPFYCHPHRLGPDTKIANRDEPTKKFHAFETKTLKGFRLEHLLMPIGTSVLLAERICKGEVEISAADKELIVEYVKKA
jgi:Fe-S-cluster containining protein